MSIAEFTVPTIQGNPGTCWWNAHSAQFPRFGHEDTNQGTCWWNAHFATLPLNPAIFIYIIILVFIFRKQYKKANKLKIENYLELEK